MLDKTREEEDQLGRKNRVQVSPDIWAASSLEKPFKIDLQYAFVPYVRLEKSYVQWPQETIEPSKYLHGHIRKSDGSIQYPSLSAAHAALSYNRHYAEQLVWFQSWRCLIKDCWV